MAGCCGRIRRRSRGIWPGDGAAFPRPGPRCVERIQKLDLPAPTLLLQIALCVYAAGAVGSLLALRHEKIATLFGFGCSTVAACFGIGAALLGLTSGPGAARAAFQLWPSLIPYLQLTVKLDPLGAFFVLIVSF